MTQPPTLLNILIVEDEALLAMDIEATVEACGHRVVGAAASLADVRRLQLDAAPDLAFVDLNLAGGSDGLDVCAWIRSHWTDVAIVFVTANPARLPQDFGGAHGVISKPFSEHGLMSAMRYIEEGILDPPPAGRSPSSFQPSPRVQAEWAA